MLQAVCALTNSGNNCIMETTGNDADSDTVLRDSVVAVDSPTVEVIAWFNKCDTMVYWVSQGEWKVNEGDTVMTTGLSMKVMLTVTDSTKGGYDMEYKFLDFKSDSIADSELNNLQSLLVGKLGSKIVGTSIKFKTDELGQITEYTNLKEIKKQAKQLYKYGYKEMMKMPVFDSLKTIGLNFDKIFKGIDTNVLVDGYTEELELMFANHGRAYTIGERRLHTDETDEELASDTYWKVALDNESGEYGMITDVNSYIPMHYFAQMTAGLLGQFADLNEETTDSIISEFDKHKNDSATSNEYLSIEYFYDGWPKEIVMQRNIYYLGRAKLKQTRISWDYRSTGYRE